MTEQDKFALFDRSIKMYTPARELIVTQEECGELVQAISKQLRYGDRLKDVMEEIADNRLMQDKVIYMYGPDFRAGVMACYAAKLERLRRRVDEGENKELLWQIVPRC